MYREQAPVGSAIEVLARRLLVRIDDLALHFTKAMVQAEPIYAELFSLDEIQKACRGNISAMIVALAHGDTEPDTAVVSVTGRRNAEEGVPLDALLHLYRMAARMIWEELLATANLNDAETREQLLYCTAQVWNVMDTLSAAVRESYYRTENELGRQDAEHRQSVIDALLAGRGGDPAVQRDSRAVLGFGTNNTYQVVVVSGEGAGMTVRDLELHCGHEGFRSTWRSREGLQIGLIQNSEPTTTVEEALRRVITGRAGCSPPFRGLTGIADAFESANLALGTLSGPGLARLDEHLCAALLVRSPDLAERLIDVVYGNLEDWTTSDHQVLIETLLVYFDVGGDAKRTAEELHCHRNTVFNRLRRLQDILGRDLDDPADLTEICLATLAVRQRETRNQ